MGMHRNENENGMVGESRVVICLIILALMVIGLMMPGCSWSGFVGARAETFYPDDYKKGGDPAKSRAAGVDLTSSSVPGRPPVPGGN